MIHLCDWLRGALLFFVMTSVARAGAPIIVEVNVPRTTLVVGESLVIEMRATNVSTQTLGPFGVTSSEFSLTNYQGDIVENCFVTIYASDPIPPHPPYPPLFGFSWRIEALQPGETLNCRITYTQTLYPGQETIDLSSVIGGVIWPRLAEFTYTLLPRGEPPRPVPSGSMAGWLLATLALLLFGFPRLRSIDGAKGSDSPHPLSITNPST